MKFQVESAVHNIGGVSQNVYLLTSPDASMQAEVWPDIGCNCLRWRVAGPRGPLDLLYVVPDWEANPAPNRSGIPVLFPFPNRVRGGRFYWKGREYLMPLNDPSGVNAIHGFACRRPWRVRHTSAAENLATLTAEFQGSVDAAQDAALWPADYRLTLRFLLGPNSLSLSATIENPGRDAVPVGLGFHPYFNIPLAKGEQVSECLVTVPAESIWELQDNLPTGRRLPVDPFRDLRTPRPFDDLLLDDAYTDLGMPAGDDKLRLRGKVEQAGVGAVEMWSTAMFREMVVFTPPNRDAVCLEPYTCTIDAINMFARGIDGGLTILGGGESVTGFVVLRFVPAA
jgi:aldose 1-epimerase